MIITSSFLIWFPAKYLHFCVYVYSLKRLATIRSVMGIKGHWRVEALSPDPARFADIGACYLPRFGAIDRLFASFSCTLTGRRKGGHLFREFITRINHFVTSLVDSLCLFLALFFMSPRFVLYVVSVFSSLAAKEKRASTSSETMTEEAWEH